MIEGLRGDAFSIARDLGLEVLSEPGGLVKLVGEIKSHVFPRAREEAKELFRAGQKQGGPLSRQPGETHAFLCSEETTLVAHAMRVG